MMKEITNSNGLYQIDELGNILSLKSGRWHQEKLLSPSVASSGYYVVTLNISGKFKSHLLHRLIADHFIPNPENKPCVNHIDGNKLNNSLDNLEWVTHSENFRHAFNTGLYKGSMKGRIDGNNPLSKPVVQKSIDGEVVKVWASAPQISRELGWHQPAISEVCNGKRSHYRNFKWEYIG